MQKARIRIDNDGSRDLQRKGVFDFPAPQSWGHDTLWDSRNGIGLVGDCPVVSWKRRKDLSLALDFTRGCGWGGVAHADSAATDPPATKARRVIMIWVLES